MAVTIGYASAGCNNGTGFISLYGVYTDATTALDVKFFSGVQGAGTQIASKTFFPNTNNGGYTFPALANGAYYLQYITSTEGDADVFYDVTVFCEVIVNEPVTVDCVATKAFTIAVERGARWCLHFPDNKQRQHLIQWFEEGYTGACEELCGSGQPLTIEYPGTGNKLDTLHGSAANIELTVEAYGLVEQFHTTDERKWKVVHSIDGAVNWVGWHIADLYNEAWTSVPFHATLQAYDGIGGLENMPYLDENKERYYGRARTIDVVFRCLRKLDLELPVYIAIDVFEDTMDKTVETLAQSYVDQENYYDKENEPLSCKEVLERCLKPYNAIVKQAKGALHIIRYTEVNAAYKRRKAEIGQSDSQVRFNLSEETYLEEYEILMQDEVSYREGNQSVFASPAYKQVTSITNYGEYENFALNGDFERWIGGFPMFWTGEVPVEQVLEGTKFLLGFTKPRTVEPQVTYLSNEAYTHNVKSTRGFTFSLDYVVTIDDYASAEGYYWIEAPVFRLQGDALYLDNEIAFDTVGMFGGTEVTFPNGTVKTGIPLVSNPAVNKRIDLAYATPNGSITYVVGTETPNNDPDNVVSPPDNALVITYVCWENNTPKFGSVSSFFDVQFYTPLRIGEYRAARKQNATGTRVTRRGLYPSDMDAESRRNEAYWITGTDRASGVFGFSVSNLTASEGYFEKSGTFTVHIGPLSVEGLPSVFISNPAIRRNNLRGVQILIDNVSFTERKNGVERMFITGENPGKINTAPLDYELYHGSDIPRTEALITLQDGTPTNTWNNGFLLQENVVRDILAQHPQPTHTLTATLSGPVSPLTVLRDPFRPLDRFFVDKYTYRALDCLTDIQAIQVFGGAAGEPNVTGVRLLEDGTPRLLESGNYRKLEG